MLDLSGVGDAVLGAINGFFVGPMVLVGLFYGLWPWFEHG
jgi:hypothetical protein